jgi:hypothetical protein
MGPSGQSDVQLLRPAPRLGAILRRGSVFSLNPKFKRRTAVAHARGMARLFLNSHLVVQLSATEVCGVRKQMNRGQGP